VDRRETRYQPATEKFGWEMAAPSAVATLEDWMCQPAIGVDPAAAAVTAGAATGARSAAMAIGGVPLAVNPRTRRVASVAALALVRRSMASAFRY
jgi:hypothetical protein